MAHLSCWIYLCFLITFGFAAPPSSNHDSETEIPPAYLTTLTHPIATSSAFFQEALLSHPIVDENYMSDDSIQFNPPSSECPEFPETLVKVQKKKKSKSKRKPSRDLLLIQDNQALLNLSSHSLQKTDTLSSLSQSFQVTGLHLVRSFPNYFDSHGGMTQVALGKTIKIPVPKRICSEWTKRAVSRVGNSKKYGDAESCLHAIKQFSLSLSNFTILNPLVSCHAPSQDDRYCVKGNLESFEGLISSRPFNRQLLLEFPTPSPRITLLGMLFHVSDIVMEIKKLYRKDFQELAGKLDLDLIKGVSRKCVLYCVCVYPSLF